MQDSKILVGSAGSGIQMESHPSLLPGEVPHPWQNGGYGKGVEFDIYYKSDLEKLKTLGLNAFRFSPYSRRIAFDGRFNQSGIDHYKAVVAYGRQIGLEPILTVQHFDPHGYRWYQSDATNKYESYAQFVLSNLIPEGVEWIIPINEPKVNAAFPYLEKLEDFNKYNPIEIVRIVYRIIISINRQAQAHNETYQYIKSNWPQAKVLTAENVAHFEAYENYPWNYLPMRIFEYLDKAYFLDQVENSVDLIGLNYYWHRIFKLFPPKAQDHELSLTGARLTIEHLYDVLKKLHDRYGLPILITETGVAIDDEDKRKEYYLGVVDAMTRARIAGVDLKGVLVWSLLDNFEFLRHKYEAMFGIFAVNHATGERTLRQGIIEMLNRLHDQGFELGAIENMLEV